MKKLCEKCQIHGCGYIDRGLEDKCEWVRVYEEGYADAVEKAVEWVCKNVEDCLHIDLHKTRMSDCLEERMRKAMEEEE